MKRVIMLTLLLAACGTAQSTGTPPTTTTTTAQADPYDTFLDLAKSWDVYVDTSALDRQWALARALLGCGTTWPPKTIDAALAQAYSVQIEQARKQGHCQ